MATTKKRAVISQILQSSYQFTVERILFPSGLLTFTGLIISPAAHGLINTTLFFYCSCNVSLSTCRALISNLPCGVKCKMWNTTDAGEFIHYIRFPLAHLLLCNYAASAPAGDTFVLVSLLTRTWLTAGFPHQPAHTYRSCSAGWENKEVLWVWKISAAAFF